MKNSGKHSRSPLFNALRKAFFISTQVKQPGAPPSDELLEINEERYMQRRKFIGDIFKTGVVVGAAGFLDACHKTSMREIGSTQPKVVIIGAGIAGLNCAYQLKKAGFTAAVYEGSTRTGGRIFTGKDITAPGLTAELGGEFIDSGHDDMIKLAQEFGLNLLDSESPDESTYIKDSYFIGGRFYTEQEVIDAFAPYAAQISDDISSLPATFTYDSYDSTIAKFDLLSIHQYLDSIGMTGFIRTGIEVAYLTEYGMEADSQSSINFLYLFSPDTSTGFDIFGASDERYKVEGGNQLITTNLLQKLDGQVNLGQQLIKIKENTVGYSLYFKNTNGTTITVNADFIVSAIPFSTLRDVELDVQLPDWKVNAIKELGYGSNAKLILGFTKRTWRDYNYNGSVFTDMDLQNGWDNGIGQHAPGGGYTVYLGGNQGMNLGAGTSELQAPKFIAEMEKMWPGVAKAFNGNVKRMHWPTYQFTKGSYACYKTGQYKSIRGAEIKPIGNFYFAGEHCSLEFQGFMNGGAETGRVAAEAIISKLK